MKGYEERCTAAGCSGFLTKPVDIDKLLRTLAKVLEHIPRRAEPSSTNSDASAQQAAKTSAAAAPSAPERSNASPLESSEPAAAPRASASGPPLVSALPTEDPEFCDIVVEFIDRLYEKLDAMDRAWAGGNRHALATLAHWLKGSGGTAGFDAFTAPAEKLEMLAKNGQSERIDPMIAQLRELAGRIVRPTESFRSESFDPPAGAAAVPESTLRAAEQGEPLVSTLPTDDSEFCEVVVEFIDRLYEKLDAMDRAWAAGDLDALTKLAHWLKGSGGTAGFDAFTMPAAELEMLAKNGQSEQIDRMTAQLRGLADRIVAPESAGGVSG
jgi:HPt (histidine-containing phosphotransfer) domain-containing protein